MVQRAALAYKMKLKIKQRARVSTWQYSRARVITRQQSNYAILMLDHPIICVTPPIYGENEEIDPSQMSHNAGGIIYCFFPCKS